MRANLKSFIIFIHAVLFVSCSHMGTKDYKLKKDIQYSSIDERNIGDLYISNEDKPFVILVHGGGWVRRDKSDMDHVAESIASHGYNVLNISYRLAPKYKHPAPIEDLENAHKYLQKKYPKLKKEQIYLWGYSSGGHTTSMYALKNTKLIRAVISGGAPYDLTWYPKSPYIKSYLGKYRDKLLDLYFKASPINNISKESPPFFLYHAEKDGLVEYPQMHAFGAKLKKNNIPVETYTIGFWDHGFAFFLSDEAIEEGIKFIQNNPLQ